MTWAVAPRYSAFWLTKPTDCPTQRVQVLRCFGPINTNNSIYRNPESSLYWYLDPQGKLLLSAASSWHALASCGERLPCRVSSCAESPPFAEAASKLLRAWNPANTDTKANAKIHTDIDTNARTITNTKIFEISSLGIPMCYAAGACPGRLRRTAMAGFSDVRCAARNTSGPKCSDVSCMFVTYIYIYIHMYVYIYICTHGFYHATQVATKAIRVSCFMLMYSDTY